MKADKQAFLSFLQEQLDWFGERNCTLSFWLRDDDAALVKPKLEQLCTLTAHHNIPLCLAVIPKQVGEELPAYLKAFPQVSVAQHGWQHINHQQKSIGEKAAEFGTRRDIPDALGELEKGRAKLEALFAETFLPFLVPPWNRIDSALAQQLPKVSITGISTFNWTAARYPALLQVQSHIDIIKWKKQKRFIGWQAAQDRFALQMARRKASPFEPIGILTHHLDHDDGCWGFLEALFAATNDHPAARWQSLKELAYRNLSD
ncbi:polysaccharide deacetylase family protein [Pseudovibrio flavus]|uniref:polysaccharide deacetylase family protein n=1 Tax=Pseudovibrio flavus TaxID=2529854 RepID=UPI00211C3EC0|nr:polysaccharide deacetylase family protein [Pseudovibrio flavus]